MFRRTRLLLLVCAFSALPACQCHGDTLVTSNADDEKNDAGPQQLTPIAAGTDAGTDAGTAVVQPPNGWCASDCDCPAGSACVASTGELQTNFCQAGTNTCVTACPVQCGAGTQCMGGICVVTPCVGSNCPSSFPVAVAGNYETHYTFDIHDFAQQALEISQLLDLLSAALSGQASCGTQTDPFKQLLCIVVSLAAQNLHAPPWVQSLLNVLSGMFKFGTNPITAHGLMQLAEAPDGTLSASESWDSMWMTFNGQALNVINSPQLGSNGTVTVTVHAFGGHRDAYQVYLGPRDIDFDVNKLLVNLLNVAIQAASNNQAQDVGGLLDLILCDQIPITNSNYATCLAAAQLISQNFELESGFGGIHLDHQDAFIYDDNADNLADHLGLSTNTATLSGSISNGLLDDSLGPYPVSNWWGDRK